MFPLRRQCLYSIYLRLRRKPSVSHIYPYVDTGVVYIRQFHWDDDGKILVVSRYSGNRTRVSVKMSG